MFGRVTVFSDASFCSQTLCAGGAFWARDSETKYTGSFSLDGCKASHEAEVVSTLYSMSEVLKHDDLKKSLRGGMLIVVVDCMATVNLLQGAKVTVPEWIADMHREVVLLMADLSTNLKVNHVKAHSGTAQPRNYVNSWCDREAKRIMRQERQVKAGVASGA